MTGFPTGRVAVISPHLDDALLSLGAAISDAVARGGAVRVVTVFGGDVDSKLPASRWDALAGFATEGEATRARRAEDVEACALVGAEPHPLPLPDFPYARERDPDAVRAAVAAAVDGCDTVLAPGFPLLHPDHRFVAECVVSEPPDGCALALYAEQPYRFRLRRERRPDVDPALRDALPARVAWEGVPVARRHRQAKWRAVRSYRSQLPLLHLAGPGNARLARMLLHEARHGGEAIAWADPPPAQLASRPR